MFRYLRALWYLLTGRIDQARQSLSRNPYVIRATYDKAIENKTESIRSVRDAIAGLVTQKEKKTIRLQSLTEEVNRLEKIKQGALAKAKSVSDTLKNQNLSEQDIKGHKDYISSLAAYQDASSKLQSKNSDITSLEEEVQESLGKINNYTVKLQQMQREKEALASEKEDTVADIVSAEEDRKVNELLVGLSKDHTSKDLAEMRDLRQRTKAEASVTKTLEGADNSMLENELLSYASNSESANEFDKLVGLGNNDVNEPVKLPEEN